MKQAYIICLVICFLAPSPLPAQTPDWSTSVAKIMYSNCTKCHNTDGIAPFPIESYQDAVNFSGVIPTYINGLLMPPWPPDPAYRHMVGERRLTQGEIDTINAWINGGTPEGNENLAPPVPHFVNGPTLGTPDLVLQIPTYTSTATSVDDYACFILPLNIPEDKYVKAVQILPGNPKIVHHAIVMIDTNARLSNQDCTIALANVAPDTGSVTLTSYAAGMGPTVFPAGEGGLKMGERLKKGSNIMLQIHYPAGTGGQVDSTKVLFYLYSDSEVTANPPLRLLDVGIYCMNWGIILPANTTTTLYATYPSIWTSPYTGSATTTTSDYSLFAVDPHMHYIGRQMSSFGVTPTNDTINFEKITNWQFNWQAYYFFTKLLKLPAGSVINGVAYYDNTSNNPYNPNYPPITITAGENSTTNEMMLIAFMEMAYETGDENYNVDSLINLATASYQTGTAIKPVAPQPLAGFSVYPNPTSGQFVLTPFNLPQQPTEVIISNLLGQTLITRKYGELDEPVSLNVGSLPEGVYLVQLRQNNYSATRKIVVGGK